MVESDVLLLFGQDVHGPFWELIFSVGTHALSNDTRISQVFNVGGLGFVGLRKVD